tara:strand:- start:815 stop:1129 length:315 start_codon:yes stop_codon:yes gene_type:complete
MSDVRTIYVGSKPIHAYVAAVLRAMQNGDRKVELVARGGAIRTAVDTAEICRRRNGNIASLLPEMVNNGVEIGTEQLDSEGVTRTLSFIKIQLEGIGDLPDEEE